MRTKKLVAAGLLIALGVILPQAFHVFGENAGKAFLPMHIPVITAGILLGPNYGIVIGIIVPVMSFMLTGMPMVPMLYFMLFELMAYGLTAGILARRCHVFVTLFLSMLSGRIVYGLSLVVGVNLFGIRAPFANTGAFVGGLVTGIPGIMIQFIIIPVLIYSLRKGGLTFDGTTETSCDNIT